MAKFIICDCAKSNWGKTTTLREVEGIFAKSSEFTNLYRRISTSGLDVWAAYERIVDKKVFFIQTEGDLKSSFYPTEAY